MVVVEVLLVRETVSMPAPMLREPAAVPLMVAESLPASALIVPAAPMLRVTESLSSPILSVPALAATVAVSTPAPRLMVSKLEKVRAPSRVDVPPVAIERVLLPDLAVIVSLVPEPPMREFRPETDPVMAVAPAVAVPVADERVTETWLV